MSSRQSLSSEADDYENVVFDEPNDSLFKPVKNANSKEDQQIIQSTQEDGGEEVKTNPERSRGLFQNGDTILGELSFDLSDQNLTVQKLESLEERIANLEIGIKENCKAIEALVRDFGMKLSLTGLTKMFSALQKGLRQTQKDQQRAFEDRIERKILQQKFEEMEKQKESDRLETEQAEEFKKCADLIATLEEGFRLQKIENVALNGKIEAMIRQQKLDEKKKEDEIERLKTEQAEGFKNCADLIATLEERFQQLKMENVALNGRIETIESESTIRNLSVQQQMHHLRLDKLSSGLEALQQQQQNSNTKVPNCQKLHFVSSVNCFCRIKGDCCVKKCLEGSVVCASGNGFVLMNGGKAEYIEGSSGIDSIFYVIAKNGFTIINNPGVHGTVQLRYFEVAVEMTRECGSFEVGLSTKNCHYHIGLRGNYACRMNSTHSVRNWARIFHRHVEDGDLVGCGVFFRAANIRPKIFFTLNGEMRGQSIFLAEDEDFDDEFFPYVRLKNCSVNANFGENSSFMFNILGCEKLAKEYSTNDESD